MTHAWVAHVVWAEDSFMPLALLCCETRFPLCDPDTYEAVEAYFEACIDHLTAVHQIPEEIALEVLAQLPQVAMQRHLEALLGDDEEED